MLVAIFLTGTNTAILSRKMKATFKATPKLIAKISPKSFAKRINKRRDNKYK